MRQHFRYFLLACFAGLFLRLLFVVWFPRVTTDSLIYGDIAKNWLQLGIYGLTEGAGATPTFIRLPGYPAFLAGIFAVFGSDHYGAALVFQVFADLGSCFLIADIARRLISPRAAQAAFLLAAVCPFLANYTAAALTETLEVFFTVLAVDCTLIGIESLPGKRLRPWLGSGLATGAAILLRPDGGLLLMAILAYLATLWLRRGSPGNIPRKHVVRAAVVVTVTALAPLVPWTVRNWHTLHQVQPLAPRYSNDQHEYVSLGFNRWVKTWMADYVSVEEIYWNVSGSPMDVEKLPARAFDSEEQQKETAQLLADYNSVLHMTPSLDARFSALAEQRIHASHLRYYVWLPLLRILDMWFRPRTELLPADTRWWEFDDDTRWSAVAVALGVMGILYPVLALMGWARGRFAAGVGLLVTFAVLRTLFLGTIENPEPRYVLECYPTVLLLASALF